jgi:hypothetical protein
MRVFRSGRTALVLAATVIGSTVAMAQTAQDPRYRRPDKQGQQGEHGQQGQQDERGQRDQHNRQRDPRWTQQQQQRMDEERRRQSDYERMLDQRMRAARAQQSQLQEQRRMYAYEAQRRYYDNLEAQRARLRSQRAHYSDPYYTDPHYTDPYYTDPYDDPYYSTPPSYRYRVGTTLRETNQYGVDMLEQAVSDGYDQGVQSGRADRQDGRVSSYRSTFAYQDANYGYAGQYVSQGDYNYYFREGFRRGYTDGYGYTSQYGSFNSGTGSIFSSVLQGILGMTHLR